MLDNSGILLFSEKSEFFLLSVSAAALTEKRAVFFDFAGLVTVSFSVVAVVVDSVLQVIYYQSVHEIPLLNPKRPGVLGGVLFEEMKFVLYQIFFQVKI